MEKQLHQAIETARGTTDTVTGRKYAADSGAAVVLDAKTGRVVAMASQPTYDPEVWSGGITSKQLKRLYSEKAGHPVALARHPGPVRARVDVEADDDGRRARERLRSEGTRLACSSGFQVGNRWFKNYESGAYGYIGFAKALEVSCNTFFYRVGFHFWQKYGTDSADVKAKDPLVRMAKKFGFGKTTGIDIPGEASGRIADRKWKLAYWKSMKRYYCKVGEEEDRARDFLHRFAREFCIEGFAYRAGDAVNFAIGQGDTVVTPLQLARAYAALSNGGTLLRAARREGDRQPRGQAASRSSRPRSAAGCRSRRTPRLHRQRPQGRRRARAPWPGGSAGSRSTRSQLRAKTGSAEVYGKQTHLVGGVVHQGLRRGDDGQPGRHRVGHVGSGHPQDLGAPLRHQGREGHPAQGRDPGNHAARAAADVRPRRVDPPAEHEAVRQEGENDR